MTRSVKTVVSAENSFTDPITIRGNGTVSINGTYTGTVSLQRSSDGGKTWMDTGDSWVGAGAAVANVTTFTDHTNQLYRAGAKTSGWTSGSVEVEVGSSDQ